VSLGELVVGWVVARLVESWGNKRRLGWEGELDCGCNLGRLGSIASAWAGRRCGLRPLLGSAAEAVPFYS
jgi:hypothetical protein